MIDNSLVVCADIGGTHITTAIVDVIKKTILPGTTVRERVDSHAVATEIINTWSKAIMRSAANGSVDKLSLAMPGPFDYEKGVSLIHGQAKYESIYKLNVKELLADKLGFEKENISLINDAASFLQGEAFAGSAAGFGRAVGITLGTGLGSCIFENRVAVDAGLWQMPFRDGIAEDYLCTRWFVKRYRELTGKEIPGVKELLAIKNTAVVEQIFNEFGDCLSDFLQTFISISKPEVVVIGGNIAKAYDYFKPALNSALNKLFPKVPIRTAQLGEDAALLGAASYWDTRHTLPVT